MSLKFVDRISSEAELSSCPHSIHPDRPSRREHVIMQDTHAHFTRSHSWIWLVCKVCEIKCSLVIQKFVKII